MIILRESLEAQTINIIPTRGDVADRMVITDETTNESLEYEFCFATQSFYISFNDVLDLKEGHFYQMRVYSGEELIHRDRIFCTNQNTDTYSVNKDKYVTPTDTIIFHE